MIIVNYNIICSLLKTIKLVHAKLDLFEIATFNTHNYSRLKGPVSVHVSEHYQYIICIVSVYVSIHYQYIICIIHVSVHVSEHYQYNTCISTCIITLSVYLYNT